MSIALNNNGVSYIRNLWIGSFTGMAGMSLHWNAGYDYALWQSHFPQIAAFLAPYNFNESSGNVKGWMPGHDYDEMHYENWQRKPGIVDLFYLRSPDKQRAIGVLANRTYNFYTQWDVAKCGQFVWEDKNDSIAFEQLDDDVSWNNHAYSNATNAYYINESLQADVKSGHCYRITYMNPFTMQTISTEKKLNATGKLNLNFPFITGSSARPIVLVKIEKESCFKNQKIPDDSIMNNQNEEEYLSLIKYNTIADSILRAQVFPNPALETINIVLPIAVDNCKAEAMDSKGMLVNSVDFSGQQYSFNVSDWKDGIYFLRLVYEMNVELIKIIIQ